MHEPVWLADNLMRVDDASHFYFESRATLNLALPYMRPDGLYVIEDWGWAHWPGDVWQKGGAIPLAKPAP